MSVLEDEVVCTHMRTLPTDTTQHSPMGPTGTKVWIGQQTQEGPSSWEDNYLSDVR